MSWTDILVAIALVLVSEELLGWMDRLSTWLVRYNARQAPPSLVARLEEEWHSDMLAKPGKLSRLLFALDCRRAAFVLTEQELLPQVSPLTVLTVRAFDIVLAVYMLVLTLPLLVVVALTLLLVERGLLFDRKRRFGRRGKPFRTFDFRVPCDDVGNATRFGAFLFEAELDRLPRFINVIRGDMSIVGPPPMRPMVANGTKIFLASYYETRVCVRPGLIFPSSVLPAKSLAEQILHDTAFVANYGLPLVLRIMLLSVWTWLRLLFQLRPR